MGDGGGAGSTTDGTKRELRRRVRQARSSATVATPPVSWADGVLRLVTEVDASVVALYSSYGTEPSTADVLDELLARDVRVLLPVTLADRDLDWVDATAVDAPSAAPLREGDVDVTRLLGRDAVGLADVVVVPALLAAHDGARLGQGGGSYDRALPRARGDALVVALVHDDELLPAAALPVEPHDRPVTHVVTPTGVVACAQPEPRA